MTTPFDIVHISIGGPVQNIIADGTQYRFEWHPCCGPIVVTLADDPKVRQPGARNPFWDAVTLWDKQGREFNDDGTCKWSKPPPDTSPLYHLGGKHYTRSKDIAEKFGGKLVEPGPSI